MVSFKVTAIATQLLAPPRNATPKRAILETRFQWRNRSFSLPNYCASAPHVPICLALLRLTGEEGSELLEAQQTYFASFAGTVPKRSKTTANWYYIDRLKLYSALMYHMLAAGGRQVCEARISSALIYCQNKCGSRCCCISTICSIIVGAQQKWKTTQSRYGIDWREVFCFVP